MRPAYYPGIIGSLPSRKRQVDDWGTEMQVYPVSQAWKQGILGPERL